MKLDHIETRWTKGLIGEGDIWCSQDYKDARWLIERVKLLSGALIAISTAPSPHLLWGDIEDPNVLLTRIRQYAATVLADETG